MKISIKFLVSVFLILMATLYIFPWKNFGIDFGNSFLNKPYTLGLDLQGGVELDYQVDLSAVDKYSNTGAISNNNSYDNESVVVEGLKKIIDARVNSLGLAEPNIQTLKYGNDTHIIVQIPTESYSDLSDYDREKRQKQDIENAKMVIGKVVNLEFKEMRTSVSDEEYLGRETLAKEAKKDLETLDFGVLSQKYNNPADNIYVKTGTGTIPDEAKISALSTARIDNFPYVFDVESVETQKEIIGLETARETITSTGFVALRLDKKLSDNQYEYSYILVNRQPGMWMPAKTTDGKILNDDYLSSATAYIDPKTLQPKVSLVFNDAGAKIFGEITTRLKGKYLAIFVGGEMVMNATVNDAITNGTAEISG